MPELPEVETVKNGVTPHIINTIIDKAHLYRTTLRYPIDSKLSNKIKGQTIVATKRRGKHLILQLQHHALIVHLGMSGSLQVTDKEHYHKQKHDHIVLELSNGNILFFNDPRRFGYWLITDNDPLLHTCFEKYGTEPLSDDFNTAYLKNKLTNKKQAIKAAIMDNHIVVGIGNIYTSESLFMAGIHPNRAAKSLTQAECTRLVQSIKTILHEAILQGGTTLKDYKNADGKPGYFAQKLNVYGKKNHSCPKCQTPIQTSKIAQRNTFYCETCQL